MARSPAPPYNAANLVSVEISNLVPRELVTPPRAGPAIHSRLQTSLLSQVGTMPRIRVLIVDDHAIARRAIRLVLSSSPDVEIVGEAANGMDAIQLAEERKPDIVLLDISLPGMSGMEAAKHIAESRSQARILFVSQHDSIGLAREAISAGAAGYVIKSEAGRDLLSAIDVIHKGGTFLSRSLRTAGQ